MNDELAEQGSVWSVRLAVAEAKHAAAHAAGLELCRVIADLQADLIQAKHLLTVSAQTGLDVIHSARELEAERDALQAEVERLRGAVIDIGAERDRLRALLLGEDAPEAVRAPAWVVYDPHDGFDLTDDPAGGWSRLVGYLHDEARLDDGYGDDVESVALYRLVPVAWMAVGPDDVVRDVRHPDAALAGLGEVSDG